jgi:predicted alpha/beta-hydrolase family hydrolase
VTEIQTPLGPARVLADGPDRDAAGTLVLGGGAGGGVDAPDLTAVTAAVAGAGWRVLRVEQPWRVAGKRIAPAPARLDLAWTSVLERLRDDGRLPGPLVLGGRSAGARVACRTAAAQRADGVLALAFPLHPPGRPERSRLPELQGVRLPTLVVQGERDTFGRPDEFPPGVDLAVVPAADHSFKVPARGELTQDEALEVVVESALEWILREVAGPTGNGQPA